VSIDWTACPAVETVPGRLSGRPVVRASRVPPDFLVDNRDEGAEWLAENYDLPIESVQEILAFYDRWRKSGCGIL